VRAVGAEVSPATAIGLAVSPVKVVLYVASKPEACTDASDEKATYSWPFDNDFTVTSDRVPVIVSTSGADDEAPL